MKDVLFIPDLDRRLLSAAKVTAHGLSVEFGANACVVKKGNVTVMKAEKVGNVYKLQCDPLVAMSVEHTEQQSGWELWHTRLGHPSHERTRQMRAVITGLPALSTDSTAICGGCAQGKMTVTSFPKRASQVRASCVLELVHADVMGPMTMPSQGGARYTLLFVDDYSRFVVGYFLKKKSEVTTRFGEFKALMENQTGKSIKKIRTENGSEFVNKAFDGICATSGIAHQLTVPYSPQQNGLVERMNRTIVE